MKDYCAIYNFTDRMGFHVYKLYPLSDAKTQLNNVGEFRIQPPTLEDKLKDDYKTEGHGTG